jgi:hypothetical protein
MKLAGWLHTLPLAACLSFGNTAAAVVYYTINPGEEAIISFHFDAPPIQGGREPDLLLLLIGGSTALSLSSTTYSLWDGNTLLGSLLRTDMTSFNGQAFRSFDNPNPGYLVGPSVPVDFSSIRAGTIQGRLVYTPAFTSPAAGDHANIEFELYLEQQISWSSGWLEPDPIVDSIQVVQIPEPSLTALAAVGLLALGLPSRRQQGKAGGGNRASFAVAGGFAQTRALQRTRRERRGRNRCAPCAESLSLGR